MSVPSDFGSRLRALRTAAGLTQQALADKVGTSRTYVNDLEAGRREPLWGTVCRLARALDTTPDAFLPDHPA